MECSDAFLKNARAIMRQTLRRCAGNELLELVSCHFQASGKLNRPRATGLLAQALGGDLEASAHWAAAVELFHNGTLIHDDLQDGDTHRRGAPCLWVMRGRNGAMNAGSFLMLAAFECLHGMEMHPSEVLRLHKILSEAMFCAFEGQCMEERLNELAETRGLRSSYFEVARLKTGALFGALAAGAGVVAQIDDEEIELLKEVFVELGVLFQMQDDILDLYGDKRRDMQGNDLKEGKVSLLILKHLELYHYNLDAIQKLLAVGRDNLDRGEILVVKEQFARDATLDSALEETARRCRALLENSYLARRPRVGRAASAVMRELVKPLIAVNDAQNLFRKDLSNVFVRHGLRG